MSSVIGLSEVKFTDSEHGSQEPPQSTPVSSPFMIPSVQVGSASQTLPQVPPQSIPVSVPFWMPSEQVGPAPSSSLQLVRTSVDVAAKTIKNLKIFVFIIRV